MKYCRRNRVDRDHRSVIRSATEAAETKRAAPWTHLSGPRGGFLVICAGGITATGTSYEC
jgi:hypothetical protein